MVVNTNAAIPYQHFTGLRDVFLPGALLLQGSSQASKRSISGLACQLVNVVLFLLNAME